MKTFTFTDTFKYSGCYQIIKNDNKDDKFKYTDTETDMFEMFNILKNHLEKNIEIPKEYEFIKLKYGDEYTNDQSGIKMCLKELPLNSFEYRDDFVHIFWNGEYERYLVITDTSTHGKPPIFIKHFFDKKNIIHFKWSCPSIKKYLNKSFYLNSQKNKYKIEKCMLNCTRNYQGKFIYHRYDDEIANRIESFIINLRKILKTKIKEKQNDHRENFVCYNDQVSMLNLLKEE